MLKILRHLTPADVSFVPFVVRFRQWLWPGLLGNPLQPVVVCLLLNLVRLRGLASMSVPVILVVIATSDRKGGPVVFKAGRRYRVNGCPGRVTFGFKPVELGQ